MAGIEATLASWSNRPKPAAILLGGIVAVACLVLGYRLGDGLVTHRPEERCQLTARHMIESGDWIVPHMDGEPRLEKPPLYYWQAAAAGILRGQFDRTALRFPSLVAGIALLIVIYLWGVSLDGPRTGLLAALCLLLMSDFAQYGRMGVAEMSLTLWTTVCLFVCDRLWWRPRPISRWLLAAAFTLAFLAKATVATMVVGLPALLFMLMEKRLATLTRLRTWGWVLVTLAACLAWYLAVVLMVPGGWQTLETELLLPVAKTTDTDSATHYHGPFYFLPLLLGGTAPACLLAPFVLMVARRTGFWRTLPRHRFVALTIAGLFITLSLIPQKQRHYLLPLLPLVALLLADSTIRLTREAPDRLRRWLVVFGALAALACLGLAVAGGLYLGRVLEKDAWTVAAWAVGLGLLAVLGWLAGRGRRPHVLATTFALQTVLALLLVHGSLSIWQTRFRSGRVDVMTPAEASRWQRLFAEDARLRRLMQAREWPAHDGARPDRKTRRPEDGR